MDRERRIKGTFYYSLVQLNTWSFYSILMSFSGNVLRSFGFSDSKISLIMGTAALLALILQLFIGELSGRFPGLKVSTVLIALSGLMLSSALIVRSSHLPLSA